ncbi:hypothetical protein FQN57_005521 [Myotisia sp. PD_48]|nr:hypothetical protein FQN57_005521 [Myotisia sp. PD_48]
MNQGKIRIRRGYLLLGLYSPGQREIYAGFGVTKSAVNASKSPKDNKGRKLTAKELSSMAWKEPQAELRKRLNNLSPSEREKFIQPYLPPPRSIKSGSRSHTQKSSQPIRNFIKSKLHYLLYFIIHIFFSIYVRCTQSYYAAVDRIQAILYYHHRTPELIRKDVKGLSQLPEHLSAILKLRTDDDAVDILMDEVAELAAWSACAGIPTLSIYEKTGALKPFIPTLYKIIIDKLSTYYGSPNQQPTLRLFAPHHRLYSSPLDSRSSKTNPESITVLLLSGTDGRATIVDLTKTLSEMAQHGKLSPHDISTNLIDAELADMMTIPAPPSPPVDGSDGSSDDDIDRSEMTQSALIKAEPDLVLVFGPYVKLDGYPPWQIRLSEFFCTGDQSTSITGGVEAVEYQRFLKGLWKYAKAEMRFGR